jgi:hypothetical protein
MEHKWGQARMRMSFYDTMRFDETVTRAIHTGPAIIDVIGKMDLDDWLEDECIKHLKVAGKRGKSL